MTRLLRTLRRNERGAVAIETAIVTPVLLLMSLAAFETSMMYARQMDLQNAAAEASQIALAAAPTDAVARATVKGVIVASTGVADEDVRVLERYRCDVQDDYVTDSAECTGHYARFIRIEIEDTYTPSWSKITSLSPLNYNVVRMVQVG